MKNSMDDTADNRKKIVRFVAQEVEKDRKIPHFTREAVAEIILLPEIDKSDCPLLCLS